MAQEEIRLLPIDQPISMVAGDTFVFQCRIVDQESNGDTTPRDLTGSTARLVVTNSNTLVEILNTTTTTAALDNTGYITFQIAAATTANWPGGDHDYKMVLTLASGVVRRIYESRLTIKQ